MEQDYTKAVGDLWMPKAQTTFDNLHGSILCDSYLRRFDPRKMTVLQTDFLANGFGYVVCHLDNDETSLTLALHSCMEMDSIF
jgi:hypothetical protein